MVVMMIIMTGGQEMGTEEEQAKDELRKAQSGPQILL